MPSHIDLDDEKIISMYIDGNSTSKYIANTLGVSKATIKRRLHKHGIRRGPKYKLKRDSFSDKNRLSSYWAGFLAADGWVGVKPTKKIRVEIKSTDMLHLYNLCGFLGRETSCVRVQKRNKYGKVFRSAVLEIGNGSIVDDLISNFNVVPAKSLILKPPDLVHESNIRSYILGYFDGDGCNSLKDGLITFNITSGSNYILKWIKQSLIDFINIDIPIYSSGNVFRLLTSGRKANIILDWLYEGSTPDTRLERKYNRYIEYSKK